MPAPPMARLAAALALLALGCDVTTPQPNVTDIPPPPPFVAEDFATAAPNPLFPLVPGTAHRFAGHSNEGEEQHLVEVLPHPRTVLGVRTTGVQTRVWLDGVLTEETVSWYAADRQGTVWHFGETSRTPAAGAAAVEGWEAGVGGARPGIAMWAAPRLGSVYYQHYHVGQAMDVSEVMDLDAAVAVPLGRFEACLWIEETTPLEPEEREHKYYCPGLGHTLTVDVATGGHRVELVTRESR